MSMTIPDLEDAIFHAVERLVHEALKEPVARYLTELLASESGAELLRKECAKAAQNALSEWEIRRQIDVWLKANDSPIKAVVDAQLRRLVDEDLEKRVAAVIDEMVARQVSTVASNVAFTGGRKLGEALAALVEARMLAVLGKVAP